MDITSKKVLNLNANWQIINIKDVKDAFVGMNGGDKNNPPVKALDITYYLDEEGNPIFNKLPMIRPVSWLEWMVLPIRQYDSVINTSNMKIRVPTVIVASNYHKIPKKKAYPNKRNLYDKQNGICGLTGKKLSWNQANIEHKIPKSQGGKESWENLMIADKEANSARGNKPYSELGIKPLFNHKTPAAVPISFTFSENDLKHNPDWVWFSSERN